jgi:hypothetical protein
MPSNNTRALAKDLGNGGGSYLYAADSQSKGQRDSRRSVQKKQLRQKLVELC